MVEGLLLDGLIQKNINGYLDIFETAVSRKCTSNTPAQGWLMVGV